jgi:hypothetical protein
VNEAGYNATLLSDWIRIQLLTMTAQLALGVPGSRS